MSCALLPLGSRVSGSWFKCCVLFRVCARDVVCSPACVRAHTRTCTHAHTHTRRDVGLERHRHKKYKRFSRGHVDEAGHVTRRCPRAAAQARKRGIERD
jgi:hypothetical protein